MNPSISQLRNHESTNDSMNERINELLIINIHTDAPAPAPPPPTANIKNSRDSRSQPRVCTNTTHTTNSVHPKMMLTHSYSCCCNFDLVYMHRSDNGQMTKTKYLDTTKTAIHTHAHKSGNTSNRFKTKHV